VSPVRHANSPRGGGDGGRYDTQVDVLVVGAGPVGLMLACELMLHGVSVAIAERLEEPMTESRASQLNARTMELFDQRGLVDRLVDPVREDQGHFGGLPLEMSGASSPFAGLWKIPQYRTEATLDEWALGLGARMCRGWTLTGLSQGGPDGGGVSAEFATGGGTQTLRAHYLVGCDGADSTVRRLAGIETTGTEAVRELLRADVTGLDVPDRRFERREHGLAVSRRDERGVTRVMTYEFGRPAIGRTEPPGFDEIVARWAKVTGEDISGGQPIWLDSFDDSVVQATTYRRGAVLLCGDAAHAQPPVGGQSLNLGLQDAVNLGWKLAATVRGTAPPGLLDTYHAERHPVGERVLRLVSAQALLLFGGPEVTAVRELFAELLRLPDAAAELVGAVSGLDVRYGEHPAPLVGARLPVTAVEAAAGADTAALLRPGGGMLLDLTADERLAGAVAGYRPSVRYVRARALDRSPGAPAVLVRPDGHVAWAGEGLGELDAALRCWFGESR
jgi:oxygenase